MCCIHVGLCVLFGFLCIFFIDKKSRNYSSKEKIITPSWFVLFVIVVQREEEESVKLILK